MKNPVKSGDKFGLLTSRSRVAQWQTAGGLSGSKEYKIWATMRYRCNNPRAKDYAQYGGRGIRVSERWDGRGGFMNFISDMGRRPSDSHSIDRTNNDGNYEPGNCRWATFEQQMENRRWGKRVVLWGEEMLLQKALAKSGVTSPCYYDRIRRGMTPTEALETPVDTKYARKSPQAQSY